MLEKKLAQRGTVVGETGHPVESLEQLEKLDLAKSSWILRLAEDATPPRTATAATTVREMRSKKIEQTDRSDEGAEDRGDSGDFSVCATRAASYNL